VHDGGAGRDLCPSCVRVGKLSAPLSGGLHMHMYSIHCHVSPLWLLTQWQTGCAVALFLLLCLQHPVLLCASVPYVVEAAG
jgi:hypothetical protein